MRGIASGILCLLLCLAGAGVVQAQPDSEGPAADSLYTELTLTRGHPQGAFEENLAAPGLGATVAIGGRVPGLPLVLLSEVGLLTFDRRDHLEATWFEEQLTDVDVTFPASAVSVTSNHHLLTGHLVVRLQPALGPIEPYVDGLLGVNYFFSRTRLEGDIAFERRGLRASTNFDDLSFSYGAGGGIQVRLFEKPLGMYESPTRLSVNLGVRYLYGPETAYLGTESLRVTDRDLTFEPIRSRTDLLLPRLGLQLER